MISAWHKHCWHLFDLNGKLILADKGYDSDKFVRWLEERGGIAVITT